MLGKLIGKVEPEARARCLRVIQAAKVRKGEALQRGEIRIDWLPNHPGQARLTITAEPEHRRLTGLHPFDLVIQAGGQVLDEYRLVARPAPTAHAVLLIVGQCPDWKTAWRDALPGGPEAGNGTGEANGPTGDRFGYLHVEPASEPQEEAATAALRLIGVKVASAQPEASQPAAIPSMIRVACVLSLSSTCRIRLARSVTSFGMPASFATWMP